MREEYEIDKLNPRANPYARELKQQITIKLSKSAIEYFKNMATETSIPYQTLINMYLDDCAKSKRTVSISWS